MIPVAGTRKLEVGAEIATFANLNLHSDYCSSILPTHPHGPPPYICVFIIIITPPIPAAGMGPSLMPQMPSYLRRLGLEPVLLVEVTAVDRSAVLVTASH
eukprot:277365_1